ncbi:MAG: VCBS repeat-containing protein, partial [Saprospiraceae bacterium]|nr:VCBS repeat-containing protein [Saprospiraceae bacterium]
YRNFYNGGGVALGDINNDGLVDIYMVSNQSPNKLYLNKGDLQFEDVTAQAGVGGERSWSTGVTFVDINNDGWLDIYVCNSGDIKGDNKENELFINQGATADGLKFEEKAAEFNLNDKGYSTHAAFFDYDKDGDLDAYILNNSYQAIGSFNLRKNVRPERDELGGDKLMENRDGQFFDVSEQAGIYGSVIGFGLGVTVSDFNNDSWLDIFISNDFFERDYLYLNQKDGTFKEDLTQQMRSISGASMGADAADINNDGNADLFVTEMLPSEYERLKTVTTFENWNKYQYNVINGYHHQFTRNMLHLNNGDSTFSEVARMAGVAATDWSWGALFFDMDNDGYKDLFVANGIYKDLTNQDYLQYISNEAVMRSIIRDEGVNYKELVDIIPSNKVKNHAYKNMDGISFQTFEESGLMVPSFSNGSAYGDLDNDGDLDLVVNNVNMPCFVYENTLSKERNNYLKLELRASSEYDNYFGIGSKITVSSGEQIFYYENVPTRGFQSSIDFRPNIGLGKAKQVDIQVVWPSGKITKLKDVAANQTILIKEDEASDMNAQPQAAAKQIFTKVTPPVDYVKNENQYIDFNRERLIYHMRSNEGGRVAKGDLNGDGKTDLVFPGAKGEVTEIFLQEGSGDNVTFRRKPNNAELERLKEAEHRSCMLFDADGDGDLDMYLASGGVELSEYSEYYYDHLFLNDGQGNFSLKNERLPAEDIKFSTGAVAHADIDNDGDEDLFVGERVKVGNFGASCSSYILINDGQGNFTDQTETISPGLKDVGMLTDAAFEDMDQDGQLDLVLVGEFMKLKIFKGANGRFEEAAIEADIPLSGWWNTLHLFDADNDGDMDIVAGNLGENSRFKASEERPIRLYFSDYDKNGMSEGVMTFEDENGKDYPYALLHNLIDQIKMLKKRFPDFESFKDADIRKIFTEEELAEATVLEANQLKTVLLINQGGLKFTSAKLPTQVQFSPVYAITTADFDKDGDEDLLLGGNQFYVLPEMGIYDASFGQYLENQNGQQFRFGKQESGFSIDGEIRDFILLDDNTLLVNISRDTLAAFKF